MEDPKEEGYGFSLILAVISGVVILAAFLLSRLGKQRSMDKKHVVLTRTGQEGLEAVIVDTETTGLRFSDQIVQIAAKVGDNKFSVHMLPTVPFCPEASQVNKLYLISGILWKKKENDEYEEVETVSREKGAQLFIDFLRQRGSKLLLVGHNILKFDAPRILSWLREFNLHEELIEMTHGFADTWPLLRQSDIGKQELLARRFLTGPDWQKLIDGAHDALADCEVLEGLLEHFRFGVDVLVEKAVTTEKVVEGQKATERKRENMRKLKGLANYISAEMVGKMAVEGISTEDLKEAYSHGRAALEEFLGGEVNGQPRITKNQRIVDKVEEFIKSVI